MNLSKTAFEIAEKYGTPFYLAYPDRFRDNYRNFVKEFSKYYDKIILGYSFKTNYTPFLLESIRDEGNQYFAETVSELEYELALKVGFPGERIILNGPIKTKSLLLNAIQHKSIINLDSLYEVEYIISLKNDNPSINIKVGLRINMEIETANGQSAIQAGLRTSRFGFTEETLAIAIAKLRNHGIIINSLHGHTSSTNHVVENFQIIARKLLAVCQSYDLNDLEYLDLGGSFFGAAPKEIDVTTKPSYADYAHGTFEVLFENSWFNKIKPYVVIEPGASVVTNVFEFITKIYQHKKIGHQHYIMVDGSIFQVRLLGSKSNFPFQVYSQNSEQPKILATVVGSTCMEIDQLANDIVLNHYEHGDLICFKAEGAYRMNMTPQFINRRAPIITINETGNYDLMRGRQTVDDFYNSIYQ